MRDPQNPAPSPYPSRAPRSRGAGGDWLKILLMGAFLGFVLFFTIFYKPAGAVLDTGEPPVLEESTPVPELDPEIMAQALDSTRSERLVNDEAPFKHLLEKSLLVTPAVARKLNMPQVPVAIASLRKNPERYRGKYLWYKGQLEYLSRPKAGHPVPGYKYYEGRLRTADGDPVLFAVSLPPGEKLTEGSWARIEGYFLKLRDAHLPVPLDRAPMLVGPELFGAYADWEAVEALDPEVLARIDDGVWDGKSKTFDGGADMSKMLAESQDVPLWHLAGYAIKQAPSLSKADWPRVPAFTHTEQFEKFRTGDFHKGKLLRILGTFVQGRILPARVNPLGIESWSEVWVQVRDLGGKTIPIWVPGRIDHTWKRNMPVMAFGYFFKRYSYETGEGDVRWTPLFVAADIEHFTLSQDALSNGVTFAFAGLVALVALIFALMAWRDRRQRQRHEAQLVDRRRQRRDREKPSVPGEQACTP